jgi:hypothetical protein
VLHRPVDLYNNTRDADRIIGLVRAKEHDLGMKCVLLFVDTVARVMPGGKEDTAGFSMLVKRLDHIRFELLPIHICAVHHAGKDVSRGARGGNALLGALDSEFLVNNGIVENTAQRNMELAPSVKFRLQPVPVGFDCEGAVVSSAVVDLDKDGSWAVPLTPAQEEHLGNLVAAQETFDGYDSESNPNPAVL